METVSPTNNAKYFGTKNQVHNDGGTVKPVTEGDAIALDQSSIADHLDLSRGTKELLVEIQKELEALKEDFPQHRHYFPTPEDPARLVGQIRNFVQNPHMQQLSKVNSGFHDFYSKIESLGAHLQQVMQRMREEARGGNQATYHHLLQ